MSRLARARLLAPLVAVAACAASARSAEAQGRDAGLRERVRVQAKVGLLEEGHAGWIPVRVSLENLGPHVRARVEVVVRRDERPWFTAARTVSLPEGGKKREILYVMVDHGTDGVTVEVSDADRQDGPAIARRTASRFSMLAVGSRWNNSEQRPVSVAIVREDPKDSSYCAWLVHGRTGGGIEVKTGYVEPRDLPDRPIGYSSVDWVVLGELDASVLDDSQRRALVEWLREGGRVLIVPGRRPQLFEDPFIRSLLPPGLKVTQADVSALPAAEAELSELPRSRDSSSFRAYSFSGNDRQGLLEPPSSAPGQGQANPERPALFTKFPVGRGQVVLAAVDLDAPPFDRWGGSKRAASWLLDKLRGGYRSEKEVEDVLSSPEIAQALNASEAPSSLFVVAIVVIYILLVGPANYALLRRLEAHVLIVITTPLLAFAASVIVFASGYLTKGFATVVQRATFLEVRSGETTARERTFLGVRSSGSATYRIELDRALTGYQVFPDAEAARGARQVIEQEGGRLVLPAVPLNMWDHAFFAARGKRPLGGTASLVTKASGGWQVTNGTAHELGRGYLATREGAIRLPVLPAGASLEVQRPTFTGGKVTGAVRITITGDGGPRTTDHPPETALLDATGKAELLAPSESDVRFVAKILTKLVVDTNGKLPAYVATFNGPPSEVTVDGNATATRHLRLLVVSEETGP